ncbi:MAG: DNA damage-inducible protein D [Deltaproteobacteria bacterium]|nr:DNA damage-inducible protein D [Deltaproteobacteria bacterium]
MVEYGTFRAKLDVARRITRHGIEYWRARDLQVLLGYDRWENFREVIEKAKLAGQGAGVEVDNQFRATTKLVMAGSGAQRFIDDCFLSRYACYLIAMNGEPRKPQIAYAQTYFAVQTRKQELIEQGVADEKRVELRQRVRIANRALNSAAKQAGVRRFAFFHDAGYQGLYGMGLTAIQHKKGLGQREDLLDRAGRAELAANEFRVTQAEEKLVRERVRGEYAAIATHLRVGQEVRNTIRKIGGTMPEQLPIEPAIRTIEARLRKKFLAVSASSSRRLLEKETTARGSYEKDASSNATDKLRD